MNIRLLRRIQRAILKEPEKFDMRFWHSCQGLPTIYNCGTAHCIGGWVDVFFGYQNCKLKLLDIDQYSSERLFRLKSMHYLVDLEISHCFWPANYERRYLAAKTHKGRARVAAQRIEKFIQSGGTV